MNRQHNPNQALPDHEAANAEKPVREVRNVNAPDLGGSFGENGQVRHHDGIGAGPGMQPIVRLESEKAADEVEDNSSAGS